MKEDDGR